MKLFVTSIFLLCSILIFSQNKTGQINNSDDKNWPKFMLVIDSTNYPIDHLALAKFNPEWIEEMIILKNKDEKNNYGDEDGLALIYPKKIFINSALMTLNIQNDTLIYFMVESYPAFNYDNENNTSKALEKYFRQNYKMPQILLDNGYIGSIFLNCIVEKDGQLTYIEIKNGIDKPLDESVRDFVTKMPPWIPAKYKNEIVRYKYTIPIDVSWLYEEIK